MRPWIIPLLFLTTFAGALAAQEARRDQIAAANSNALESLRVQVGQTSIGDHLTVADLLHRTGGDDTLIKTLARAQQIGGPRRLDEQTYQVRLEISGARVRQALLQIAGSNPSKSPVDPTLLAGRLANWDRRTFSATGTSAAGASVDQARPIDADNAWAAVPDSARCAAIHAAKQNAVARVIESIRPVDFTSGKTVGDVLAVPAGKQSIEKWLAARPVTQLEFEDDLQVRVTLVASGDELFDAFRSAAAAQRDVPVPADEQTWSRIRHSFERRADAAEGRATAGPGAATRAALQASELPRTPPDWAQRQLEAEGSGIVQGNRLKSARAAEANATATLRAQLESLPLTPDMTVGKAARHDPRFAAMLTRGLARARTARTEYLPDGTARVRVVLDLADIWQEIDQSS